MNPVGVLTNSVYVQEQQAAVAEQDDCAEPQHPADRRAVEPRDAVEHAG